MVNNLKEMSWLVIGISLMVTIIVGGFLMLVYLLSLLFGRIV